MEVEGVGSGRGPQASKTRLSHILGGADGMAARSIREGRCMRTTRVPISGLSRLAKDGAASDEKSGIATRHASLESRVSGVLADAAGVMRPCAAPTRLANAAAPSRPCQLARFASLGRLAKGL